MPLESWPKGMVAAQAKILEEVAAGNFDHRWCPLTLADGENVLELEVSCDALMIEGVRVAVQPTTEQQIADMIGAVLLTPKLVDQIYAQTSEANRLSPKTGNPDDMTVAHMISQSARVDTEVAKRGAVSPPPIVNAGKDWVLVKKIFSESAATACGGGQCAANYGWLTSTNPWEGIHTDPTATLPGVFAIQGGPSGGTRHSIGQVDYSQLCRLAKRAARLNGRQVDLADVYVGKEPGGNLVMSDGPLPDFRQPSSGSAPLVPPAPPPKDPPPGKPAPPAPVVTAAATGGAGIGVPVTFSLLGAGVGSLARGMVGAGLGAVAGLVLGLFLRPKKSAAGAVAGAAPAQEGAACDVWAVRGYEWNGAWQDAGTKYYADQPSVTFTSPAPPYFAANVFCGIFGRADWDYVDTGTNY